MMNEFLIFYTWLAVSFLIITVICSEVKKEFKKNREEVFRMLEIYHSKFEKKSNELVKTEEGE